jgi:hypothetical protein
MLGEKCDHKHVSVARELKKRRASRAPPLSLLLNEGHAMVGVALLLSHARLLSSVPIFGDALLSSRTVYYARCLTSPARM